MRYAGRPGGLAATPDEPLNPPGAWHLDGTSPDSVAACMQHFLDSLDYPEKNRDLIKTDPLIVGQSSHVIGKSTHILGPSLSAW